MILLCKWNTRFAFAQYLIRCVVLNINDSSLINFDFIVDWNFFFPLSITRYNHSLSHSLSLRYSMKSSVVIHQIISANEQRHFTVLLLFQTNSHIHTHTHCDDTKALQALYETWQFLFSFASRWISRFFFSFSIHAGSTATAVAIVSFLRWVIFIFKRKRSQVTIKLKI